YPAGLADMDVSGEMRAGADVHTIPENTVVVHRSAGVEDASHADPGAWIDDGTRKGHRAGRDVCMSTDDGRGMHDGCQLRACSNQSADAVKSYRIGANGHDDTRKSGRLRQQGSLVANDVPGTTLRLLGPGLVEKDDVVPTALGLGCIRYDLAVPTCTQYRQGSHGDPRNFSMVACP